MVEALRRMADEHERPTELGPLELTITPVGPLDRSVVEEYRALGIDRLVLLPQPDADREHRHATVPLDRILANIDAVSEQLIKA